MQPGTISAASGAVKTRRRINSRSSPENSARLNISALLEADVLESIKNHESTGHNQMIFLL